jgi:hypothetical protein
MRVHNNPLTSNQNSVCPDTIDDEVSDINVMGRWYRPPSNEEEADKTIPTELTPEKTKTIEIVMLLLVAQLTVAM